MIKIHTKTVFKYKHICTLWNGCCSNIQILVFYERNIDLGNWPFTQPHHAVEHKYGYEQQSHLTVCSSTGMKQVIIMYAGIMNGVKEKPSSARDQP